MFFKKSTGGIKEVRKIPLGGHVYLTQEDLDAEQRYNAEPHGPLGGNIPELEQFKTRKFSLIANITNPTEDEQDVLYRIDRNGVTGEQLLAAYANHHKGIKDGLAFGMAWCGDILTSIERRVNLLPALLESLIQKGAVIEQTELKATSALSM